MNIKKFSAILLAAISVVSGGLILPRPVLACGPFVDRAVFAYQVHPEIPIEPFADGRIGVLRPTYARSYLIVAYRYLAGLPLDEKARDAVTSLWKDRLDLNDQPQSDNGVKQWTGARSRIPGAGDVAISDVYRQVPAKDAYADFLNCSSDSFAGAARTLSDLTGRFGVDNAAVKDWLKAQDQVYSNCSSGSNLPAPSDANAPRPIQAARRYQIAAANFYAGNYDAAADLFNSIAGDADSPWRQWGHYLQARALIRKATLTAPAGSSDLPLLARAETILMRITGDDRLMAVHAPAGRLLDFVRFRLHPDQRLGELSRRMIAPSPDSNFKQGLTDFTLLLDKYARDGYSDIPAAARDDSLADWVFTFQAKDQPAAVHAIEKWKQTHSVPWMVAALAKATAADSATPELLAAAANIQTTSPGFVSVVFHRARLMTALGQRDAARSLLDAALQTLGPALPVSSGNLLRSERMRLAHNLPEFLTWALRKPCGFTDDEDDRELPDTEQNGAIKTSTTPYLDDDATRVLNIGMPLSLLEQAASSKALPAARRANVALAAWCRAVLVDDTQGAAQMVPVLDALVPKLKPDLDKYAAESDPAARKFAAVLLMLRFPGVRPYVSPGLGRTTELGAIDEYRDNWWCSLGSSYTYSHSNADQMGITASPEDSNRVPKAESAPVRFLSQSEKMALSAEWKRLAPIPVAPDYFPPAVVAFARSNPQDPRVPEALYLAVRSTRYGCTDKDTARFSKEAFELLHKQYPNSEWTKKTRYWFGNSN